MDDTIVIYLFGLPIGHDVLIPKHKADRRSRPSLHSTVRKPEPVFAVKLPVIASYVNC
jgi:hypothetical protein